MIKMEHMFAKRGALLEKCKERLRIVFKTYKGKARMDEIDKVLEELDEWYEDMEVKCARWREMSLDTKDIVVELRREVSRLRTELNDIAET